MKLSVLLAGLGQIGMGYDLGLDPAAFVLSHARAMSTHPRFQLAGGVDSSSERRSVFTSTYGAPAFASVAEAARAVHCDLAIVATSTATHAAVVGDVLDRFHPKLILCEKPLSCNIEQARRLYAGCVARRVPLLVNYMRRADPAVIEIKRRIDTGVIGGPIKGVVWYTKGLRHNGSHFLDLMAHWLGPIEEARIVNPGRTMPPDDSEPDLNVRFERGTAIFLAAREEAFSHYTIELVASNGRLRYDRGGQQVTWQTAGQHPRLDGYAVLADPPEGIPSDMDHYQWHVAGQVADAIDGRPHQLCTGQQALEVLEHVHAIHA